MTSSGTFFIPVIYSARLRTFQYNSVGEAVINVLAIIGYQRYIIEISSQHSTLRPTSLLVHYSCEYAAQSLTATLHFSWRWTC